MPPAARNYTKGMSPKHVRKAHVTRSSGNDDPIFCKTTFEKYTSMSPKSQKAVRDDTRVKLSNLDAEAAKSEKAAKRRLLFQQTGSSAEHATSGSPKKKKNNQGQTVAPDSPDCGLPVWHPGRDGTHSSLRIYAEHVGCHCKGTPVD